MLKKVYDWVGQQVNSPFADPFLALFAFLESIIFPPAAPLLILYCIENPRKSYIYALITTVFSVIGGVASYYLGYALWESVGQTLVNYITTPESFQEIVGMYQKYQDAAVAIGSFSPFPYKALALTAGFCNLSLSSFILYSLVGRGIRYFMVAIVLVIWGPWVKELINRWFYQLAALFLFLMSCSTLLLMVWR